MKQDTQEFPIKYSEDELLNHLRELAAQLGRTPKKRDLPSAGKMSYTSYYRHFGSLQNAQKAAGLVPTESTFLAKHSEDDLLNHLRVLAKQLGRTPKTRDLTIAGKICATIYNYHFGNLGNAQKAAGLVPNKSGPTKYSREELLNHLRALAKQLGRTPTCRDLDEAGKMSYATYYEHFGSWGRAQKAAGLVPNIKGVRIKYPERDLINHLKELATQLGRTPTLHDIAESGKMSNADYVKHFGSLQRAQKAAGLVPSKHLNG